METRIIIAGGRDFDDYERLEKEVLSVIVKLNVTDDNSIKILSGTARGADLLGEKFAEKFKYETRRFPASWHLYGKNASFIRNEEMAKHAAQEGHRGVLIAFWDGKSQGTKLVIDLAKDYKLNTFVINL